jgi:hypothetical protein
VSPEKTATATMSQAAAKDRLRQTGHGRPVRAIRRTARAYQTAEAASTTAGPGSKRALTKKSTGVSPEAATIGFDDTPDRPSS